MDDTSIKSFTLSNYFSIDFSLQLAVINNVARLKQVIVNFVPKNTGKLKCDLLLLLIFETKNSEMNIFIYFFKNSKSELSYVLSLIWQYVNYLTIIYGEIFLFFIKKFALFIYFYLLHYKYPRKNVAMSKKFYKLSYKT